MTPTRASDSDLLRRFRDAGDRAALAELFARHHALAYRVAFGVLGTAADAEDAAQEAFVQLVAYAPRIKAGEPLAGLIARMALFAARRIARAAGRRQARESAWGSMWLSAMPCPQEEAARRDTCRQVLDAVQRLGDGYRLPVMLHYVHGLSTEETASALGISPGAARVRLSRAVARLREQFAPAGIGLSAIAALALLAESVQAMPIPATLPTRVQQIAAQAAVPAAGGALAALALKLTVGGITAAVLVATGIILAHQPMPATQAATPALSRKTPAEPMREAPAEPAGPTSPGGPRPRPGARASSRAPRTLAGVPAPVVPKGPTPMRPDYAKLTLIGDNRRQDAFTLTMLAAARLFGRELDYDTVYALSTNAFAPDARPDEECRSDWMRRGRGQCLDLVAARLGLTVRPLGGFAPRAYGVRHAREAWRQAAVSVREALARDEVVITDSGWTHDFAQWGIVLSAGEDGRIVGATPDGRTDNVLDHPCSFWALAPGEMMPAHQADVEVLRRAVARIRGDAAPFVPESLAAGLPGVGAPAVPGAVVWGLPAMDLWIAQMGKPAFQEGDPGSSAGNARRCAREVAHGAEAAARYLRTIAPGFPVAARPHLEAAAGHYGRIADLLSPALTGEGGERYAEFMGDLAKQRAHIETALKPVRAELEATAGAMQDALAAIGEAPQVTFTGDGVKQDSAALALVAAAKALGREVPYARATVLLGNGFAPAIVPGEGGECPAWWQMFGREHNLDLAARAIGLTIERLALPPRPDEAWADPKAALAHRTACVPGLRAALRPGQVILTTGGWESNWNPQAPSPYCYWGLITEVHDDGTITGATLNGRADNPLVRVDPCWVVSLAEPTLTPHEADLAVLRRALDRIHGDRAPFAVPASIWEPRFGVQALQVWIRQMRRVPFCTDCNERSANCAMACTTTLAEGARASAAYLRDLAPAWPAAARVHLEEAAKHYARIAELAQQALTGEGGPSLKAIIGDEAAQRAFADGKLYAMSDRLAMAAQEIELALVAVGVPPSGRLFLKGDGVAQDSASLAFCAAARTLGVAADYDEVYALSGNAFSPMVDLGEDCTAWWQVESWMAWQGMDVAAARLGLATTPLPAPAGADAAARRRAIAPAIRQVKAEGGAVVALGGWQVQAGHGFVPWGWAGVVTEAKDDGTIMGACLNGRTTNPLERVDTLRQVRRTTATLPEHGAHLAMLRLALARWYGETPFAGDAKQRYGARAMDAWIGQMRTVKGCCPGCEEREGKGWTCAVATATTAIGGATTAGAYLRRIAPTFSDTARAHLLLAAMHYDKIVGMLRPAVSGVGGPGMQGIVGDLAAQQQYAATTLQWVRDRYEVAAQEIELALIAEGGPPSGRLFLRGDGMKQDSTSLALIAAVRTLGREPEHDAVAPAAMELPLSRDKRRTWIEGFATPGGLRPLVQFMGRDGGFAPVGDWYATETFPLFMGVCGDAFRFIGSRQDGGQPERGDAFAVASPAARYLPALDAAGFDARVVFDPTLTGAPSSEVPWDAASLRREIVASIAQRKRPVLLTDLPEPGWNAVIVGYEKDGETLVGWCEEGWESFGFRFDPARKRKFDNWFPRIGGAVLLTARHPRPAEADVLRAALAQAVPELRRRTAGRLLAGPATYEELARRLGDPALSAADAATAATRDGLLFPSIWDLATQRSYAAGFLARASEVFPAAAEDLKAASDLFQAIHDAVWEINRIGGGDRPGSPLPKTVDPAVRKRIAEIVLQCRDRDLDAATRIEAALRTIAAQPPAAGRRADYEAVYALGGNAFSPMLDLGEDCTAWWQVESWMAAHGLPNVGLGLGLRIEKLDFPELHNLPDDEDGVRRMRIGAAPRIREVQAKGGAVLALGWWLHNPPHGFVPWGWAGVVTEAKDDGAILGACLNGRRDNPLHHPEYLWAVYPGAKADPHAADLAMLKLAIDRWEGKGAFAGDDKQRYGRAAMDAWIANMRTLKGFCGPCEGRGQNGWSCAASTADTAIGGATAAAVYLRRIAPTMPEAARPHLLLAAEHYERIVALLQPFSGRGYQGLVGDLDRQRAHADAVLVPVQGEYAAATEALGRALATPQEPAGAR